jgi:hypothetical protein
LGRWARVGGGAGRDCTELGVELGEPFVLALDQRSSGFHEAAGLHPLNPTIGPLTSNNLGSEPSAGAASGAPEGEEQGIAEKLAAFSGTGSRPIGRANANALAAEGDAGEGWWRNQWARAVIWVAVSKPSVLLGVFWGGVELVLGLAAA